MFLHAVLLSTGLASIALFLYFKVKFSFWSRLGVPHPKISFPFGSIDGRSVQVAFRIDQLYQRFKGAAGLPFFGIYFMHQPWAVLTDLDLIKKVFITDFRTFPERDVYANEQDDPLSAHLSAAGIAKWQQIRPRLSPGFSSGKMRAMYPEMVEVCGNMAECLDGTMSVMNGGDHQEIDVKDVLGKLMTDIIGRCVFGVECNSLQDKTDELRRMGKKAFDVPRFSGLTINVIKSWKPFARALGVKVVLDDVSGFFVKFVREIVQHRESHGIRRSDLIDLLIRMKKLPENALTNDDIAAQSFIFFLAGFENAATTLAYTLYELALNPHIQCKARAEIRTAMDQMEDGFLTYDAMMKLTYIEQVINESLRKYPPVPVMTRTSIADYAVPNTNIVLPKGSTVLASFYSVHHDPQHFPNPDLFQPERFSTEGKAGRSSAAFLAFGAGPRNCIGARFAMMQCRVGLVALLMAYEFAPGGRTPPKMVFDERGFLLTPKGGVWLEVNKL